MTLSLGRDLYLGVYKSFFAFFSLGAAVATAVGLMRTTEWFDLSSPVFEFLEALESNVSALSPHILMATIFVACLAIALRGFYKTPKTIESKVFHPLLALACDTVASAFGYFAVAVVFSVSSRATMKLPEALEGLGYFFLAALLFWVGRAIAEGHGNKVIWGTNSKPKFNNFPRVLVLGGLGGIVATLLVIWLT